MKKSTIYNKKVLLLVIDGLGIGEMNDVRLTRPQDKDSFTLKSVLKNNNSKLLNNFTRIGLGNIIDSGLPKIDKPLMNYGKNKLAHFGADTFWGHQEIVGTKPKKPIKQFVDKVFSDLKNAYSQKGYSLTRWKDNEDVLIVDNKIAISNNIEADLGTVINVIGSLNDLSFNKIVRYAQITRSIVKTSRVLAMTGSGVNFSNILKATKQKIDLDGKLEYGISMPDTGLYKKDYNVLHMGYGVDPNKQITTIAKKNGYDVTLIGKAADIIECEGAKYLPAVSTNKVSKYILKALKSQKNGIIMANVQETDLAGHEQDPNRFFNILCQVNNKIPEIIDLLKDDDLFIITGDHGDDPNIGHSGHTREYTPLLALVKGKKNTKCIGTQETLSDIAATIADYFKINKPENGLSFLDKVSQN